MNRSGLNTSIQRDYCQEAKVLFASMSPIPNPIQKRNIDRFIRGCKADGNWDEMDLMYFFSADSSANALLNWKFPGQYTAMMVSSPLFTKNLGIGGHITASYLDTGWNPAINSMKFTQNNCSMGIYSRTNAASNSMIDFGANTASQALGLSMLARASNDRIAFRHNSINSPCNAACSDSRGFLSFKNISSVPAIYRNGQALATTVNVSSTGIPSRNMYICCRNDNGTPASFTSRQYSFFFAGSEKVDMEKLYNRVQTYLTTLGANI